MGVQGGDDFTRGGAEGETAHVGVQGVMTAHVGVQGMMTAHVGVQGVILHMWGCRG